MCEQKDTFENAKWIWAEKTDCVNQYADFVCDFYAQSKATLKVVVSNEYVAYLNGEYVGSGAYQSYKWEKYYDEISLPVKKGKNRLAIVGYVANENFNTSVKDGRGICFKIISDMGNYQSDKGTLCRKSKRLISGERAKLTVGYGVIADLREDVRWMDVDGDTSDFSSAVVVEDGKPMQKRPVEKLVLYPKNYGKICAQGTFVYKDGEEVSAQMQNAYLSAKRLYDITENYNETPLNFKSTKDSDDNGVYLIIDLGEESTGYFTIDVQTEQPLKIDYTWGEHLGDLRVTSNIGTKYYGSITTDKGRNVYTEYFRRLGLRYLGLYIHGFNFVYYGAGITPCYYPVKIKTIKADNVFEQRLYKASIRTLVCCMHEHYEDCPWREQAQYAMDTRNQLLAGYYAFDNTEFARASIKLMSDKILKQGGLPMTQPSEFDVFIPNFSLVYAVIVEEYVKHVKDYSILPQLLPRVEEILTYYEGKIENGLLKNDFGKNGWNFFEWAQGLSNPYWAESRCEKYEYALPNQAFLILAEQSYITCLGLLGKTDNRREELLKNLRKTTNERFFSKENGVYHTYLSNGKTWHECEYTQALAVCAEIANGENKEQICSLLATENNGLIKMTLSDYLYKYQALLSSEKDYKQHVKKDVENTWGEMLFEGATTFYEVKEGRYAFGGAGSLCHGWSAIPIYFYLKYQL